MMKYHFWHHGSVVFLFGNILNVLLLMLSMFAVLPKKSLILTEFEAGCTCIFYSMVICLITTYLLRDMDVSQGTAILPLSMDSGTYLQCFSVSLFPKIHIQRNHYESLCYSENINRFR